MAGDLSVSKGSDAGWGAGTGRAQATARREKESVGALALEHHGVVVGVDGSWIDEGKRGDAVTGPDNVRRDAFGLYGHS